MLRSAQRHDRTVPGAHVVFGTGPQPVTRAHAALTVPWLHAGECCPATCSRAACSPAATSCTARSVPARAVASTSPTTSGCAAASRSRCCTRRSPTTPRSSGASGPRPSSRRRCTTRNIVTVYDWGEDDVPFMVLELLEGGSLRSMLDQGTLLTVAQAARSAATSRPRSSTRTRATCCTATSSPPTSCSTSTASCASPTSGLPARSPRRAGPSPRAACSAPRATRRPSRRRVVQLDARSDLYSLALVLVEAVTGRVPFAADTTIGMLTARTQRPLVAPQELGPLAPVIDRAGRLDPDERYPDAATMRQALADVGDDAAAAGPARARGHGRPRRSAPDRGSRRPRSRRCSTRTPPTTPPAARGPAGHRRPSRRVRATSSRAGWCRSSSRS